MHFNRCGHSEISDFLDSGKLLLHTISKGLSAMCNPLGYDSPRDGRHDEYRDLTVFLEAVDDGERKQKLRTLVDAAVVYVTLVDLM